MSCNLYKILINLKKRKGRRRSIYFAAETVTITYIHTVRFISDKISIKTKAKTSKILKY